MAKTKFKYCVLDVDEESRYEILSAWDESPGKFLAEDAAYDFHARRSGWECDWPLVFRIFNVDGEPLGDFEVDREMEPVFNASEVPKNKEEA